MRARAFVCEARGLRRRVVAFLCSSLLTPQRHPHAHAPQRKTNNTTQAAPNPAARLRSGPNGPVLKPGDPVLTFVNRNLEPYRGYHRFMRALPAIQQKCPDAITVIDADGDVTD